ncbi:MAG: peptidylprolyl isomerase [Granulosicoccus sp.]
MIRLPIESMNRNLNNTRSASLANCLGLVLLILSSLHVSIAQDVELDRIRAVVNEGVVLDSDLKAAVAFYKQQAQSNSQSIPADDIINERLLDQLINQEVRRQHARQLGVSVDPGSVNRAIEQIARNNNMDTFRFRETIREQGIDYDEFRQNVEEELLLQRLIERDVQSRIRVSQQEIDDFVDAAKNDVAERQRYRISHILIAVPSTADDAQLAEATTRANAVLASLRAGENFAQVAAASSDGVRALDGGDLGWRTLQELPEFVATAVSEMRVDELAGPLRSENGLHVIQLADKQTGDLTTQAETLARHIFIAGEDASIEQTLAAARQEILGGTPFGALAASLSQDPNSADNDGELPWFTEGQMPPAMQRTADSLDVNEISQPFRTQFGWHLMQLLDRRVTRIDEQTLREQAANALRQRKVEQETERWSRQLRDESYVEIRS